MYDKLRVIVLHTIKYSDKNSIVHLFSQKRGRISFLLPQGSSRAVRMKNAMFMPLSILEIDAKIIPGRDISTMREVRSLEPLLGIHTNPIKNAVAMFIAELIGKIVQGGEDSYHLFSYLEASIKILDRIEEGTANFHICFLYKLGGFLGIQPDTGSYRKGYAFDMGEGQFIPFTHRGNHILPPDEAQVLMLLERMSFSNMHRFRFNRGQRNELLELMLRYYQLHNSTLGTLKSPDILSQLFD